MLAVAVLSDVYMCPSVFDSLVQLVHCYADHLSNVGRCLAVALLSRHQVGLAAAPWQCLSVGLLFLVNEPVVGCPNARSCSCNFQNVCLAIVNLVSLFMRLPPSSAAARGSGCSGSTCIEDGGSRYGWIAVARMPVRHMCTMHSPICYAYGFLYSSLLCTRGQCYHCKQPQVIVVGLLSGE